VKLYPVTAEILREQGAILLEHVGDGFEKCAFFMIQGDAGKLQSFLEACLRENLEEGYADFYYSRLTEEQKADFRAGLREEELQVLDRFVQQEDRIYYPLTEESLAFLADITARGWLFSTFYFTKQPCTVWGNYDGNYPVFCHTPEEVQFYRKLAETCGLQIF